MSGEVNKCPQDGGFIGDSGCTHPNHEHSALVKGLLEKARLREPGMIDAHDAEQALREGFSVNTATAGIRVGFGKRLLEHTNSHREGKAMARKELLLYAVKTVRGGKRRPNPKGGPNSFGYAMRFEKFGMLVCTDKEGQVEEAFTFFYDEKKARGRRK